MSYTQSNDKFCSHCKLTGKTYTEYTSHNVRNQTILTCPDLLRRVCKNCPIQNHTWDRCPLTKTPLTNAIAQTPLVKPSETKKPAETKKPIAVKNANKNRFSGLEDDTFDFDPSQLLGISHQDQINCLGEEIYKRVLLKEPERACMITGMLLEIIIPDLITMLNTPEMFDSLVADSVEVLAAV